MENSFKDTKGAMPQSAPEDDRVMKDIPPIPSRPLDRKVLFPQEDGKPDLEQLKTHLLREGRLDKHDAIEIVRLAKSLFSKEPNLLRLNEPITVCGDIHGQYYDLCRLLKTGGDPKDTQYLFLGDYVDRGCFATEVVFYLFCIKISYPKTFFLLRGNHECRHLTAFFNFKEECLFKYDLEVYEEIMDCFDCLPVSAVINDKFLCMHGGLSPDIGSLKEIDQFQRFREIPREGPMCDMLWSDPFDAEEEEEKGQQRNSVSKASTEEEEVLWFRYNESRQCSFVFGKEAVKSFLSKNSLVAVIRAHEAQFEGYKMHMRNDEGTPQVITIFSAPNYCDVYMNKGACLKFDNDVLNIKQFTSCEHPYYLPNFMDIFSWSLPFVAEKVMDILVNVIAIEEAVDAADDDSIDPTKKLIAEKIGAKKGVLRGKVMAVTRMMRMYRTLREENELVLQLKQLSPNHKIPVGLLRQGADAIKKAISTFMEVQKADKDNEKMPPPEEQELKTQ